MPRPPRSAVDRPATGRAFGLEIDADFPFPGLVPATSPRTPDLPAVALRRVPRRSLPAAWPADTVVLSDRRRDDGRVAQRMQAHPQLGHRLQALGWGTYDVAPGASLVGCAPIRQATWRWQRYLVGQVLPFVAVLHGYEVFHASVVARDGRTIAITGASGSGKSTLATSLLLRGWQLVADDVLVVDVGSDDVVRAHQATGLLNVRHDAVRTLGAGALARLGREVGRDEDAVRIEVGVAEGAHPLSAVYVLGAGPPGPPISSLRPVDPRLLLASSFNFVIQTADRLTRQLDVCARLATTVGIHRVTIAPGVPPSETAGALEDHALAPVP